MTQAGACGYSDGGIALFQLTRHKEDRFKRLDTLNAAQTAFAEKLCIHQLFERQAAKTPQAIALLFDDCRLTYLELNAKADQLAFYLRQADIRPNTPVGLLVERSFEMVIGMLAVLKAGGAYVPIDPDYPQARIDYILEHTSSPVLLTRACLADGLKNYRGWVVDLDNPPATCGTSRPEPSDPGLISADLRALFAAPTLAELAAAVGNQASAVEVPPNLIPESRKHQEDSAKREITI